MNSKKRLMCSPFMVRNVPSEIYDAVFSHLNGILQNVLLENPKHINLDTQKYCVVADVVIFDEGQYLTYQLTKIPIIDIGSSYPVRDEYTVLQWHGSSNEFHIPKQASKYVIEQMQKHLKEVRRINPAILVNNKYIEEDYYVAGIFVLYPEKEMEFYVKSFITSTLKNK